MPKFFCHFKLLLLLLIISTMINAHGATDNREGIFDPDIRTVSLRNADNFMAPPVIRLNTDDKLRLNFDIIGDAYRYLRYRILHCNADWKPSRLLESEYLDSFNEGLITDYAYSSNTYVHYVNYNLLFPNEEMPIIADGNYLLEVYDEDDLDKVLIRMRFAVTDNSVVVRPILSTRTDRGFNTEWQQLDLELDLNGMDGINPYQDIIVNVIQNNRPETLRATTHPLRVVGNTAVFEHDQNLIFPASNEYRRFETVRTDYPGMNIDSVIFGGTNWHAYLVADAPRYDRDYFYDRTQHGRFMVDEYNATDPDLGADYVTVHFTLDTPMIPGAEVYVDGDFNLHRFDSRNKMTYDHNNGMYTAEIPLKQGSYNYQYVVVPNSNKASSYDDISSEYDSDSSGLDNKLKADSSLIEGNKYETQNEYLIKVFLHTPGSRSDRLVGTAVIN